jgi:hypothetical protein
MRRREMGAEVRNRAAVIVRPRLGQVPRLYQGFPHQAERSGQKPRVSGVFGVRMNTRRSAAEPSSLGGTKWSRANESARCA